MPVLSAFNLEPSLSISAPPYTNCLQCASSAVNYSDFPSNTMRAFLLIVPLIMAGCVESPDSGAWPVSRRQILKRAKAEVALRESWANTAVLLADEHEGVWKTTWRVNAGAFDYSDYPEYHGIQIVPGTERELRFSHDGCLIAYIDRGSRCLGPRITDPQEGSVEINHASDK